jgi:hypothetical protein
VVDAVLEVKAPHTTRSVAPAVMTTLQTVVLAHCGAPVRVCRFSSPQSNIASLA